MKYTRIQVQPFNVEVLVIIDKTIPAALKSFNDRFVPKHSLNPNNNTFVDGAVLKVTDEKGIAYWSIILTKDTTIPIIVHECFHLCMLVAENKGCTWSEDSNEFYAYSLEMIVSDVLKFFNSKK